MGQISSMVLFLDKSHPSQGLLRCELFERQDRSYQQTCLPEGQRRSPFFSRFWARTKK